MQELKRQLNLYGLTMIVIGSCIGSGIFITSNEIAGYLVEVDKVLLVWILGGLVSLFGALTFAELGGLFPKSGGVYVYLKNAYGDLIAFLYGWVTLFIINTGAIAALSVAFVDFLTHFIDLSGSQKTILAILIINILTYINMHGVKISQILANFFSGIKIFAILFILAIGLILGDIINFDFTVASSVKPDISLTQAFLLAFVGVFWSFGGWHHSTYLSGEVIKAQRTVPKAMIIGVLSVTVLYLMANIAYFLLLPIDQIIASKKVAADAIGAAFSFGGSLVSILVMCSLIGTIAIYTMTAPRIYFAMAKDGLFFKSLTKVHPKYKTPYVAMYSQAVCASLFVIIWGTFVRIITFVTFMDIVFMLLAAATIFIFRKRIPEANRPYKTIAYPVIPVVYVLICSAFVINLVLNLKTESLAGLAILIAGIPVFMYFKRQVKEEN